MEILLANIGRVRTVVENGIEYLVAPITSLVPGVLAGNEGPVMYPVDETQKSTQKWNGIPLVNGHPRDESGKYISAKIPGVLEKYGLGEIRNSRFNQKLQHEAWFSVSKVEKVNPALLLALYNHQLVEVSTGLDARADVLTTNSYDHLGRAYAMVARDYAPDHIAVLTGINDRGACSISDGCGLFANQAPTQETNLWLVNPKGQWEPPPAGDAPAGVKRILKAAYSSFRDKNPAENAATKARGAKIAWGAVKRAGWYKDASGKWKKRKKRSMANSQGPVGNLSNQAQPLWKKLTNTLARLVGITNQPSHSDIRYSLAEQLRERFEPKRTPNEYGIYQSDMAESVWIEEIYDKYVVYRQGEECYKLGYTTDLRTNRVELSPEAPVEVSKVVTYKTVSNQQGGVTPINPSTPVSDPDGKPSDSHSTTVTPVTTEVTIVTNQNLDPQPTPTTILPPEKDTHMPLTPEVKTQIVTSLANCKCQLQVPWKGQTTEQLGSLSDDTLTAYDSTRKVIETVNLQNSASVVPTAAPSVTVVTPIPAGTNQGMTNTTPVPATVTAPLPSHETFANRLTPEEQEDIAYARAKRTSEKAQLINRLVEPIQDAAQKQVVAGLYNKMGLQELTLLVNVLPAPQPAAPTFQGLYNQDQVNWMLAGGAPITNAAIAEEPLPLPQYDFSKN